MWKSKKHFALISQGLSFGGSLSVYILMTFLFSVVFLPQFDFQYRRTSSVDFLNKKFIFSSTKYFLTMQQEDSNKIRLEKARLFLTPNSFCRLF